MLRKNFLAMDMKMLYNQSSRNGEQMAKVQKFKDDTVTCKCALVPVDESMMIVDRNNKLKAVYHRDCPEHGWHEIAERNPDNLPATT